MRFALISNERTEASPGLKGLCPGCSQPVTAKCGQQRLWHWAHLTKKTCDHWWEPETEWHRNWKNKFPLEWQEIILRDEQSGEKHIADTRTAHGLVIEFQHSRLKPEERMAREGFYKNMVWVVNGARLKNDFPRFLKGKNRFSPTVLKGFFLIANPKECFPVSWLDSQVPVVFDFQSGESANPVDAPWKSLWCLLPGRVEGQAVVAGISPTGFVEAAFNNPYLFKDPAHKFIEAFREEVVLRHKQAEGQLLREWGERLKRKAYTKMARASRRQQF